MQQFIFCTAWIELGYTVAKPVLLTKLYNVEPILKKLIRSILFPLQKILLFCQFHFTYENICK